MIFNLLHFIATFYESCCWKIINLFTLNEWESKKNKLYYICVFLKMVCVCALCEFACEFTKMVLFHTWTSTSWNWSRVRSRSTITSVRWFRSTTTSVRWSASFDTSTTSDRWSTTSERWPISSDGCSTASDRRSATSDGRSTTTSAWS